jgi:lipopolysaccharide export system permease protein
MIGSMDMIKKYDASILNIFYFEIIKVPQAIYDTLPITIVAATLFVMITLIKQNELVAFVSIGGKIRNIAIPFLLVGVVLSILLFILSEKINPKIELARERYKTEKIKKKHFVERNKLRNLWIKSENRTFINVNIIDPIGKRFRGLKEYYLDKDYKLYKILEVAEGIYKGDKKWEFHNEKIYDLNPVPTLSSSKVMLVTKNSTLTGLINLPGDNHKYLNAEDFKVIIDLYKEKGLNVDKYLLYYYKMFAHPLSILVLIISVLPMSITLSRHHSYIKIASSALATGFAYWILNATLFSLSKTGIVSPFVANFLPHILLTIFAIFYTVKRERGG